MEQENFSNEGDIEKGELISQEQVQTEVGDEKEAVELEKEIKILNLKADTTVKKVNDIEESLGVSKTPASEIVSVRMLRKKIKNLVKKAALIGVLITGTNEALSQSDTTQVNNPQKTKIETSVSNFYNRLQDSGILPDTSEKEGYLNEKDFQEKSKDKAWLKQITDKYCKVNGILTVEEQAKWDKEHPGAEVIKETEYGLNVTEGEVRVLSKEKRQKEIASIWNLVNEGKHKIGDVVLLSNGESYLIKPYKPGSFKTPSLEDASSDTATNFELIKKLQKKEMNKFKTKNKLKVSYVSDQDDFWETSNSISEGKYERSLVDVEYDDALNHSFAKIKTGIKEIKNFEQFDHDRGYEVFILEGGKKVARGIVDSILDLCKDFKSKEAVLKSASIFKSKGMRVMGIATSMAGEWKFSGFITFHHTVKSEPV